MSNTVQIKVGSQTISVPEFTPGLYGKLGYSYADSPQTMQSVVTPPPKSPMQHTSDFLKTTTLPEAGKVLGLGGTTPPSTTPPATGGTTELDKAVAAGTMYKSSSGLYFPTAQEKPAAGGPQPAAEAAKPSLPSPMGDAPQGIVSSSDTYRESMDFQEKQLSEERARQRKQLEEELFSSSLKRQIEELQGSGSAAEPPTFSAQEETTRLMREHDMNNIASEINSINADMRELEQSSFYEMKKQERRPGATIGSVSAKQMEMQRNVNEQLDAMNRRRQTLVDEYSTKMNMINMVMDNMKYDYQTAYTAYNDNWQKSFNLQQMMFKAEDVERNHIRADASVLLDMMAKIGPGSFTQEQLTQLQKFEMQLGYPSGILTSYVNSLSKDVEVLGTMGVDMADGTRGIGVLEKSPSGEVYTRTLSFEGTATDGTSADSFTPEMVEAGSQYVWDRNFNIGLADFQAELSTAGKNLTEREAASLMATATQYALTEIPRQSILSIEDRGDSMSLARELHNIARKDPTASHVSYHSSWWLLGARKPSWAGQGGDQQAALLNYDAIPIASANGLVNHYKVEAAEAIKRYTQEQKPE